MLRHMSRSGALPQRHVRLFKNGRNQAVRIPREFELPGEDAVMRKDGDRLILRARSSQFSVAVLATLKKLDEKFPAIPDAPPDRIDL